MAPSSLSPLAITDPSPSCRYRGPLLALMALALLAGCATGCTSASMPEPVACTTLPAPARGPEEMVFDAEGHLWIAYGVSYLEGALRLTDPTSGMCQHLHRDNTLEVRSVSALAVDFDGNVWFGGWDRGDLVRFDGRRWRTYTTYDGSAGEGNSVFDITAAPNGDLWVGVPRYAYHLDGDEWTIYGVEDGLPGFGVSAIAVAPDGTLWLGGLEPLGDGDNGASVVSFDGATWTAYGIEDGLGDSNVNDIAVTPDGVVWIGTRHGISRFDGERWVSDYADLNVSDVEVDAAGGVWFATDEGVLRLDDQTDLTYTEEDGLPNTEVDALALAPDGTPWAGTRDGIAHFRDGTWTSYPIGER